jgi:CSLREA domain-containing protein
MGSKLTARRRGVHLIALVLLAGFTGCMDRDLLTGPDPSDPAFARAASGPVVNTLADDGDGTCTTKKCTLRDAIITANDGETITFGRRITGEIVLTAGALVIVGRVLTIAGPGADQLTIRQNDSEHHVFDLSSSEVTISGVTITGGKIGVRQYNGDLELTNVSVRENQKGVDASWGLLEITNSVVSDNAEWGIYSLWASGTVAQTTIAGNGWGGIGVFYGQITVTGSTVSGNQGGGITASHTTPVHVIGTTISDNWQEDDGGGLYLLNSTVVISGSTIANNEAEGYGGGIYFSNSNLGIMNSTISGNTAGSGGGIYTYLGTTLIVHSTITANEAAYGGGIYNASGVTTAIKGSIIAGNTGGDVAAEATATGYYSQGYNLIGQAGANVVLAEVFDYTGDETGVTNPGLAGLAENGGPTRTHALLGDSPAIDAAGSCASWTPPVSTDQRGVNRPQGSACDIGAYEVVSGPVFESSCTYAIHPKNGQRNVTVTWVNAAPGVTLISIESDGALKEKRQAPTAGGSWSTNMKSGSPSYGLWGGTSRTDAGSELVSAGSSCTQN